MNEVHVGLKGEGSQLVTPERTASHIGSGSVRVYATPMMALFVERFCRELVEPALPKGQTTVGVSIELEHLAPTPVGDTVSIRAQLAELEGHRLTFVAELWDSAEKIGSATHTRVIIDLERFLRRVELKAKELGES